MGEDKFAVEVEGLKRFHVVPVCFDDFFFHLFLFWSAKVGGGGEGNGIWEIRTCELFKNYAPHFL